MISSPLVLALVLAAPQAETVLERRGETPRLIIAVQGGYGAQLGARFSGLSNQVITTGSLFGLDVRYRVAGPFSLGVFGRYSRTESRPSASDLATNASFSSDSVVRGGALFALSHRFRFIDLGGELGLGYQSETNRGGPTGHVTVSALWVAARIFSLGVFVEGAVVRDVVGGGLACQNPTGQCTLVEPVPYGWFSGGIRGTFNLL